MTANITAGLHQVEVVGRERYSVTYRTNILTNPAFDNYAESVLRQYLAQNKRTEDGGWVTIGGCDTWTPEGFIGSISVEIDLGLAWRAVLAEDNFITQSLRRAAGRQDMITGDANQAIYGGFDGKRMN